MRVCVCAYWNAVDFIGLWYEFDIYMFTKEELGLDLIQTFWYFHASYKVTTFILTNGKSTEWMKEKMAIITIKGHIGLMREEDRSSTFEDQYQW